MNDTISYELLENVATIHKGINIATLKRKGITPKEADLEYGLHVNDVVIKKICFPLEKRLLLLFLKNLRKV